MLYFIKKIPLHYYSINGVAIAIYFYVFSHLLIGISPEIMFSTSDAGTYMEVSDWIASGKDSIFIEHRPILFPLILLVLSKTGGVFAIWLFQFILWVLSVNLLFACINLITTKKIYAYFGAMLLIANLSMMALTFHALTEITTTFLLTLTLFFFLKNIEERKELFFIHRMILCFVLLTIIKPVFFLPLLFLLFLILPVFYFRKYKKKPSKLILLLLVLTPLIAQMTLMKVKYNSLSVSNISKRTFTRYILAQGIQKIEDVDRDESLRIAESQTGSEQKEYLIDHFETYQGLFWQNVEENIKGKSTFLAFPKGYEKPNLVAKMKRMNNFYFTLHIIFLPLTFILFMIFIRRKMCKEALILAVLSALSAYYIIVTGISFFQGDRLVIAVITLWIFLYLFVTINYVKFIFNKMR